MIQVNQTTIYAITIDKASQRSQELTLGHDKDDQRLLQTSGEDNKSSSNILKDIKKFDGGSNPEEWLEYVINKLDEMNFSIQEKYKSIPELLSGKALIWYSDEQEKIPNFVLFIKHFLKHYQQNMDQSCTPTPMIQDNVTYQQNDRKDDVINSLRNQMLIMNLEKFPKFSGKSKQNPSKWLTDIQEKMEILKLTADERLALIPSCLETAAHDWFNDNKNSIPTWQIFMQKLLKPFESSGKTDISFNRLRHYEQGPYENVKQYYFEIMKLCKEANPNMDEASKLQYLKDGLKPSLRFDVLLKNPKDPEEFLDYAKKVEELKSLDETQHARDEMLPLHHTLSSSIKVANKNDNTTHKHSSPHIVGNDRKINNKMNNYHQNNETNAVSYNVTSTQSTNGSVYDRNSNITRVPLYQCYKCGTSDHFIRNCPHFQ